MAEDGFRVAFDPDQLAAFLKSVKAFEPKLATALRRNLRRSGDQTVAAIKAAALAGPGSGETGVRAGIAAGTKTVVATGKKRQGVKITTTAAAIPEGHKPMLRLQNKHRFRHPVYGRRSQAWVIQQGGPYFGSTIHDHEDDMRQAVLRAVYDTMDQLGF